MGCFFSPAGTGDRGTGIRKARATCAYRITSRCKGSQHKWSVYTVIFLAGRCWTTFFFLCLLLIPLEVGNPLGQVLDNDIHSGHISSIFFASLHSSSDPGPRSFTGRRKLSFHLFSCLCVCTRPNYSVSIGTEK